MIFNASLRKSNVKPKYTQISPQPCYGLVRKMISRRNFFQTALGLTGGLLLPYEPKRIYSFANVQTSKYIVTGVQPGDVVSLHTDTEMLFTDVAKCDRVIACVTHYTEDREIIVRARKAGVLPFTTTVGRLPTIHANKKEEVVGIVRTLDPYYLGLDFSRSVVSGV